MDKVKARAISRDVERALAGVAERHGCEVTVKGEGYDTAGDFRLKVEFAEICGTGVVKTPERVALEQYYPNLVGVPLSVEGAECVIIGYRPLKQRRPFVVRRADERVLAVSRESVERGLGKTVREV